MIIDKFWEFADASALSTAATGVAAIGSSVNMGLARDIGAGKPIFLVITVDTAVTSGGSATVEFQLVSDGQAALAVDGTATVHWKSGAIPKATLVAGYMLVVPLPSVNPAYEQYVGLLQNVAVAALTAGKFNAFLTYDPPGWKAYADADN